MSSYFLLTAAEPTCCLPTTNNKIKMTTSPFLVIITSTKLFPNTNPPKLWCFPYSLLKVCFWFAKLLCDALFHIKYWIDFHKKFQIKSQVISKWPTLLCALCLVKHSRARVTVGQESCKNNDHIYFNLRVLLWGEKEMEHFEYIFVKWLMRWLLGIF